MVRYNAVRYNINQKDTNELTEEEDMMHLKKYRIIGKVITSVIVILIFIPILFDISPIPKEMFFTIVFFVIIDLIFMFRFLRCPFCKACLSTSLSERFCTKCGMRLDEKTSNH